MTHDQAGPIEELDPAPPRDRLAALPLFAAPAQTDGAVRTAAAALSTASVGASRGPALVAATSVALSGHHGLPVLVATPRPSGALPPSGPAAAPSFAAVRNDSRKSTYGIDSSSRNARTSRCPRSRSNASSGSAHSWQ